MASIIKAEKGTRTVLAIFGILSLALGAITQFGFLGEIENIALQVFSFFSTFLGAIIVFNEYGRKTLFTRFTRRGVTFISLVAIVLGADLVIKGLTIFGFGIPLGVGRFAGTIDLIISGLAIIGILT